MTEDNDTQAQLQRMARDIQDLKGMVREGLNAMSQAEAEVPEMMRRFANYFHDVVHIKGEYVTLGLTVPPYVDREMERCADRFRHILEDLHQPGGKFEQVLRDMASRPGNRYDHTKLLKEMTSETGNKPLDDGRNQDRAPVDGDQPPRRV